MRDQTRRELFRHMFWADDRILRTVSAGSEAKQDQKILELLYHLHIVQKAFLQLWREEAVDVPTPSSLPDVESIAEWSRGVEAEIADFIEKIDDSELSRELPIPWAARVEKLLGRPAAGVSVGQSMVQVAMHSAYHRGQVNARLRVLGVEPPMVDFIAWVWVGQPEPESAATARS